MKLIQAGMVRDRYRWMYFSEDLHAVAADFRDLLVQFQEGTKPRGKSKVAQAEVAGAQGTLAVVIAEFDKRFPRAKAGNGQI